MKRCLAFLAAIGLVACATSTTPPDDGVIPAAGVEAGDEGNPYGGGDDGGSDSGDPTDSGTAQDASDTGTSTDSAATDTGTSTGGVCAKTTLQGIEYGADILGGTGTDCSSSPSVCASGECCYPNSVISLCVTE